MYFFNLCRQILRDMRAQKMRSFLALFGIIWGTITVVLLLALGTGFRIASLRNMMTIADGTFFASVGKTSKSFRGYPKGQPVNIKASSVMDLKKAIPAIKMASPWFSNRVHLRYKKEEHSREIAGVSGDFGYLQKIRVAGQGRFINQLDVTNKNYVIVLGDRVKERLFGDEPAVGKTILVKNIKFTVIGVTAPDIYNRLKYLAAIPYSVYINIFGDQNVPFFMVFPDPNLEPQTVQNSMRTFLAKKYHFAADDKLAVRVIDTTKFFQFMRWFFIGIQLFLGICGALTLGVGSLGVANIMFLIVTERTREIGVRMAIGASDWQILWQIILEALILVALGGSIGLLISYLTVDILQYIKLPDWLGKPVISTTTVIITIIVLSVMGIFAGFFPAKRASKMDPVEALGY